MAQVEHRPPTGNLILAIGIALRAVCFTFAKGFLSNRVELTSPLVSFDLVEDGVALLKEGISPYSGDSIHMQPLLIHLFALFSELPEYGTMAFFVGMDVLAACFLRKAAQKLVNDGSSNIPNIVVSCFLLNPVTIASCSVQSLSVLNNLLLAAFVHAFTSGYLISSSILLGSLGQMTLYHYILIGCIFLRFRKIGERVKSLAIIIFTFASLCFINFALNQFNWNFIEDSYLFMYYVDDVTPSCSIFWYFFTQVFEHFRFFYISVFQINLLVYLVPLYLTVRNDNNLHLIISMLLIAVFSPYPTLNDATIYMALLPTLYRYRNEPMRFILPISCAIVSCIVLMPIMWHMWIINGSGNANFYFAVTIIYNLAQVYLLGDLLFAYFRKEAVAVCGDYITEKTSFIFH